MIPAPVLQFAALAPLAFVVLGALGVLLLDVTIGRRATFLGRPVTPSWLGSLLAAVAVASLALAIALAGQAFHAGTSIPFHVGSPLLRLDHFANFSIALLGVLSLFCVWLSITPLGALRVDHGAFYALVLLSVAGGFLLVAATDLVLVFVGLELLSLPLAVLAGFERERAGGRQAALKVFLTGALGSAVLLYGIALLAGAVGTTSFAALRIELHSAGPLAAAGLALVLVGFAFKLALVPFHGTSADVLAGAPAPVAAFLVAPAKIAVFLGLLRFLSLGVGLPEGGVHHTLWALALLTLVVGNAMLLVQRDVTRLLAWASVAQGGTVLVGFVSGTFDARAAAIFYLAGYGVAMLGAFGVVIALGAPGRPGVGMTPFTGLARARPGLAALMTIFVLSLAGVPGTVGFMARFTVFAPAVAAGNPALVAVAVASSILGLVAYVRLPVAMFMGDPAGAEPRRTIDFAEGAVLVLCATAVLFFGFFPTDPVFDTLPLLELARDAVRR